MIENAAIKLVKRELPKYRVRKLRETPQVFLFMCEAPDPNMMPSKIAVAVNKKTSALGSSISSLEDAIQQALKDEA
jgi:hypothetical protein